MIFLTIGVKRRMLKVMGSVVRVSMGLLAIVFLATGCSSSKSRVGSALDLDTNLKVNFIVDGNINPDENKRPSPVYVRLYELKSPAVFQKSDFIDLYERDTAILGADFVNKQILKPLSPGVNRTDNVVLKNGATTIGLYVEFSQYRGVNYKVNFPIVEHSLTKNEITVKISGTDISIVKK
jgi:type VI secretion system protein VasD